MAVLKTNLSVLCILLSILIQAEQLSGDFAITSIEFSSTIFGMKHVRLILAAEILKMEFI